jgi:FtsP/CotA-like multicopper oxidase with cupredoxin domain
MNLWKISRRETLRLGLLAGSTLLSIGGMQRLTRAQTGPQLQPFQQIFQLPPLLQPIRSDATTDYYELHLKKALVEVLPGTQTEIWGYNGITPGPTIRQSTNPQQPRRSVVRVINQLGQDTANAPINTVMHLHGMSSLPQYDGYTTDYVPPAHYKNYVYTNDRVATLWYHDHTMDLTARNVAMGMLGLYIVDDNDTQKNSSLPTGDYDIPLIIQAKRFAQNGDILLNTSNRQDAYGELLLVNGVPLPRLEVANRKYRFRILNASATRHLLLALSQNSTALSPNETLTVIGSDSGLLSQPVNLTTPDAALPVAIAERYEVIIDFSQYAIGQQVYLHNIIQGNDFSGTVRSDAVFYPFIRFDVVHEANDDAAIPEQLVTIEPLPIHTNTPTRTFTFGRNSNGKWTINDQVWDQNRIDANPKLGDIEIWTFINLDRGRVHPVHLHSVDAQLLDRNGAPPQGFERGWKDVFILGEQETIRVAIRFRGESEFNGRFMMHCHQLVHEDNGMMSQFQLGQGGADPVTTAPARPLR